MTAPERLADERERLARKLFAYGEALAFSGRNSLELTAADMQHLDAAASELLRAAPPPQQTEPPLVDGWLVERQRIDTVGELLDEWTPVDCYLRRAEADGVASSLERKTPRRVVPLYRAAPPALEPGQRIEGFIQDRDIDWWNRGGPNLGGSVQVWTSSSMAGWSGHAHRACTLIIHGATEEGEK